MRHASSSRINQDPQDSQDGQDVGLGYIRLGQPATTSLEERPNESSWHRTPQTTKEAHILHLGRTDWDWLYQTSISSSKSYCGYDATVTR